MWDAEGGRRGRCSVSGGLLCSEQHSLSFKQAEHNQEGMYHHTIIRNGRPRLGGIKNLPDIMQ